jgi:hypothetical protein
MSARIPFAALALWSLLTLTALAQDCQEHVRSTAESLETAKRQMSMTAGQSRQRTVGFLADAERLLNEARTECERAKTPLESSYAIAKTLVAQGNLAAAQLFIKGNPF